MPDAAKILSLLKDRGITHMVGIPDNTSAPIFYLAAEAAEITLLTTTREGEAFALAAGLWIGGKRPVVLVQNTGLLESGDSFRGTVMRMRIPLLCLVTYRGFARMTARGWTPAALTAEILSRADLDSAALVTEPTLKAWGISHYLLQEGAETELLGAALEESDRDSKPVVVLLP